MQISAKIIADSENEFGNRITTMVVTFPRFILAEFNTHRLFSRNSASSRAIPFEKMVEMVKKDPFIPIAWQRDHKGMQGTKYIQNPEEHIEYWLKARDYAVEMANNLSGIETTKQLVNRLLEPFMWHTVIVTATEWDNFFDLRSPKYEHGNKVYKSQRQAIAEDINDSFLGNVGAYFRAINKGQAEIHMMALAEAMFNAYQESQPKFLQAGEYHIPFGDNINGGLLRIDFANIKQTDYMHQEIQSNPKLLAEYNELKVKIAVARCARISYLNYEGTDDYEKDFKLYQQLAASRHMSPFEHVAIAMSAEDYDQYLHIENGTVQEGWCRNFRGFIQLRSLIE